jgi:hypothetical protein
MAAYTDDELNPPTETDAETERDALINALSELDLQCQSHGLGSLPQVLAQIIRERHGLTLGAL